MNVAKIVAYALVLIVKMPGTLLSIGFHKRRGSRTFRNELIHAGVDPAQAEELTRMYRSIVPSFPELIKLGAKK
ncbi:hypothetical protein [Paenibacillus thermotolerans]|uniref:hypothetical protein n=1 Tax=Paenibacillus thermotolerans TaxID=3027807 RepID=UPI0023686C74|nr:MULTISPECIES: hypothetical protein [unclassified Paenibacillus]